MPPRKAPKKDDVKTGSLPKGEPVYLAVGLLRKPHGLRGDLLLEVYTDFPERLKPGTTIFAGDKYQPLKITRRRPHNDGMILGFEGINTPEEAGRYRATVVYVPTADRPILPEGEYYHHEIIGLTVLDETGKTLGTLSEIIITGANDVYVVTPAEGNDILFPALKEVILGVDLSAKTMRIHLLPGLIDEKDDDPE
jgi:16S rRNA processing protein RimM